MGYIKENLRIQLIMLDSCRKISIKFQLVSGSQLMSRRTNIFLGLLKIKIIAHYMKYFMWIQLKKEQYLSAYLNFV